MSPLEVGLCDLSVSLMGSMVSKMFISDDAPLRSAGGVYLYLAALPAACRLPL